MLGLRELLSARGFEPNPKRVKLVRHKDSRFDVASLRKSGWFDAYQQYQSKAVFDGCDQIVTLLGEEGFHSLFIGVYDVVDWGKGALAWHQWFATDRAVLEIRPSGRTLPPFRDYLQVLLSFDELVGIDALLVDYYEGKTPHFAGKVRAGFTPRLRREVFTYLKPLHTPKCPFIDLPNSKTSHWGSGITAEQMPERQWGTPKLVAHVRLVEWAAEGHLRHPAFLGCGRIRIRGRSAARRDTEAHGRDGATLRCGRCSPP